MAAGTAEESEELSIIRDVIDQGKITRTQILVVLIALMPGHVASDLNVVSC